MSFFYKHSIFQGNTEKSDKGEMRKACFGKGVTNADLWWCSVSQLDPKFCWIMHLSRSGQASVQALHKPPALLQTQGISRALLILACVVQNIPLCSASWFRTNTQHILSCCHPNRTGRTSHSSCFSHSSEPGVLHHVINQLRVQLSQHGHPGIWTPMESHLVQGSFPFFLLFSESIPEEITASEQTWHNRGEMKSRNWTRCKTPPK